MYLDNDYVQFYQAMDGQLVYFLYSFYLRCLAYEFMEKEFNHDNAKLLQEQDQNTKFRSMDKSSK